MSTTDRAARLVRQHAETARLLGVDFMPLGSGKVEVHPAGAEASVESEAPAGSVGGASEPGSESSAVGGGARDRAAAQRALDELRARYEREAPHERFTTAHTRIVFGDGDPCARLMFIGEAPGAEEDKQGIPFVGRAGKLLNDMITAMGLRREDVYIANVLKTRPPNNATPTMEEARLCAPFLHEQIRIVAPEVIVTLGLPATRVILDSTETMGRLRGRWGVFRGVDGREVPVMPTYHPAFLLRSYTPENRRKVWSDLCQAMDRLGLPRAT